VAPFGGGAVKVTVAPAAAEAWSALLGALATRGPAPCQTSPVPDAWFESRGPLLEEAQKACGGCGVRAECLAYAVTAEESDGVWGGLTAQERAAGSAAA
jgi:hypothetical protein